MGFFSSNERASRFLRETFVDKEKTLEEEETEVMIRGLFPISHFAKKLNELGQDNLDYHIDWLSNIGLENVDTIFSQAESPIEKIFFNGLNVFSLVIGHPLFFWPSITIVEKDMIQVTRKAQRAYALIEWYRNNIQEKDGEFDFLEWAKQTGDYTTEYQTFLYQRICDRFYDARYIVMQPTFPDVIPNTAFPIRADAYIWSYTRETRTVVECDGFEYHKEKSTFIRDRQRDRFFKAKGYDVVRFSGTEIYHEPLTCASQLFEYLHPQ